MTEESIGKGLDRCDFIKRTAVGAGVISMAGLNTKMADAATTQTEWDREADVVVVGAGGGWHLRFH